MTPTVQVVAAVFVQGGRVLACRRAPGRAAAGRWEFPGGKIESGESPPSALIREVTEELGVQISVGDLLDRSITEVDGVRIDLDCRLIEQFTPEPRRSTDHDRLLWCTPEELAQLNWAAPDRPAVTRLLNEGFRFIQARAADDADTGSMTEPSNSVRPKLVLPDAAAALDWYEQTLDAHVTARYLMGTAVVFAELTVFQTAVTVKDGDDADPVPQPGPLLDVVTDDPDGSAQRMTAAGAEIIFPIADQPYGARGGRVRDPYGVQWLLQTPISMSPDEVQAALDRMADG